MGKNCGAAVRDRKDKKHELFFFTVYKSPSSPKIRLQVDPFPPRLI